MPLFTTDSNNIFGKSLKEAGTYNVRVTNAEAKNSKSGNPMVEFNYEVLDGQYAGAPIRYDYAVWTDDTEDHFNASVRRFNTIMISSDIPSGKSVENLPQVASVMNGRKLAVSVDWEESQNGNWYLRVKSYHKLLQDGSQPNGKTRPEGQNERQSNFGGNRSQSTGYRQQAPQVRNNGFGNQTNFNAAMPTNGQQQQPADKELPF